MTHKDLVGRHSRGTMRRLRVIAEWLYLNELDEVYGDFKPKRLPKFGSLKAGRKWKLLYEAFQMWKSYRFVCLVLDRSGLSDDVWLRRIINSCCHAGSCSCRERLRKGWGK